MKRKNQENVDSAMEMIKRMKSMFSLNVHSWNTITQKHSTKQEKSEIHVDYAHHLQTMHSKC